MIAKGDKEAERKAVKDCPKEWQEQVKTHIRIKEARLKWQEMNTKLTPN